MKKKPKTRALKTPKVDPYLEGLMAKLLDRLSGIEKKVDALNQRISSVTPRSAQNQNEVKPQIQNNQHRDRTLYEAVCADCHKVCEVPFRPTEDRPVYCKECFARRKSGGQLKPSVSAQLPPGLLREAQKRATSQAFLPKPPALVSKRKKTDKKSQKQKRR